LFPVWLQWRGTAKEKSVTELHKSLENLHVFARVAHWGSFQGAATELALPRSSVSKRIQALEVSLAVRLFQRTTRQLALTEAGQSLLTATLGLQQVLANTQHFVQEQQGETSGRVKISCSGVMGDNFLLPVLQDYCERYPKVNLDLNFSDSLVDLIEQRVDIAIRVGQLPDSSMVARLLGTKSWSWVASPRYLARYGAPQTPQELAEHDCIVFKNASICLNNWQFCNDQGVIESIKVREKFTVDDGRTLVSLACQGLGITMIDKLLVQKELAAGQLQTIFNQYTHPQTMPIHLVCLGKHARSKAVESVWQYLYAQLTRALNE
jgi:DNA-binding transcriptional LysR family regulator